MVLEFRDQHQIVLGEHGLPNERPRAPLLHEPGDSDPSQHRRRDRTADYPTPPRARAGGRHRGRGAGRGGGDRSAQRRHRVQGAEHVIRALPPVARILLEAAHHHGFEPWRHGVAMDRERVRPLGEVPGDDLLGIGAQERRPTGKDLVAHHSEGVDVDPMVEGRVRGCLLRRHVGRRAEGDTRGREVGRGGGVTDRLGDPEVGHQGVAPREENVFRLDVAVHHAVLVRIGQRIGHFADDPGCLVDRQRPGLCQSVAERLALHERHHVKEDVVGAARIVEGEDVGVVQPRGDLDLAEEALGTERGRQLRAQHLHGHLAVVLGVLGEIHGRHAAGAELAGDPVPAGQRGGEAIDRMGHSRENIRPGRP